MSDRRHGLRNQPLSYRAMERFASTARSALLQDRPLTAAVSGIDLFEDLDELEIEVEDRVLHVNYGVNYLPTGIEGMSTYDQDREEILVTLDHDTYLSLVEGTPRALFCLCHELGHVCVHAVKLIEMSSIPHEVAALNRGEVSAHRAFEDTEWQANAFAAAFLMPAAGLAEIESNRGVLTAQELTRRFNVSFDAARIRLDSFRVRRNELLQR
jgi:IrrE N-terminal-like domain